MTRRPSPRMLVLDTCVWLDNYLGERPGATASRRLIDTAMEQDIALLYAATAPKDVQYIVEQTLKRGRTADGIASTPQIAAADREVAWACVENMAQIASAVGLDESDLWLARKYRKLHDDIEDNLVIAAVQRAHADYLVTNDLQLIRHAPVAAITPLDLLVLLELHGQED